MGCRVPRLSPRDRPRPAIGGPYVICRLPTPGVPTGDSSISPLVALAATGAHRIAIDEINDLSKCALFIEGSALGQGLHSNRESIWLGFIACLMKG